MKHTEIINQSDLTRIEKDLNKIAPTLQNEVLPEVARQFALEYRDAATFLGCRETGAFINGIASHRVDAKEFVTASNVNYSGFIEFTTRKKQGRKPANLALHRVDARDFVGSTVDEEFDKILKR
jgi:hypothetical protein